MIYTDLKAGRIALLGQSLAGRGLEATGSSINERPMVQQIVRGIGKIWHDSDGFLLLTSKLDALNTFNLVQFLHQLDWEGRVTEANFVIEFDSDPLPCG